MMRIQPLDVTTKPPTKPSMFLFAALESAWRQRAAPCRRVRTRHQSKLERRSRLCFVGESLYIANVSARVQERAPSTHAMGFPRRTATETNAKPRPARAPISLTSSARLMKVGAICVTQLVVVEERQRSSESLSLRAETRLTRQKTIPASVKKYDQRH